MTIFKLPDLGEGLPDAEVVEWHVKVGDLISLDQKLVSMETAKAVVEVPSPFTGRVVKLFGPPGALISTGAPLVEFETVNTETAVNSELKPSLPADNLSSVGGVTTAHNDKPATVAGKLDMEDTVINDSSQVFSKESSVPTNIKATPAVRALAQRLKIDLATVTPTGAEQTLTLKDVENAAKTLEALGPLEPLKGPRRTMAQMMSLSHASVVPVTVMDDATLMHWTEGEDITVRLIQAIVAALQKEPALNAWFDAKAMGRRLSNEIHLGLAVDTGEDLFVPVLRNVETLNAQQLRQKIDELKKKVYERSLTPQDLRSATMTLSNFGKFAGRYSNPIVVPPMVAILGVGKLREEVIVFEEKTQISKTLPLSLTFDHRAVTGGEATRFLGHLLETLGSKA